MNDYQQRLDAAVAAARKAGEYLLSQPAFSVSHKQSNDYVTDCDRGSEVLIREMLLTAFPQDGFLGEETAKVPVREDGGSSIPSTAPPTSSATCRCTPSPSPMKRRASWWWAACTARV